MERKNQDMRMNKITVWVVLSIMMLVLSWQLNSADCRVLRSETAKNGCEDMRGADRSTRGMASFDVSASNSSTSPSVRGLKFRLASGPSRRGPGH